MLISTLALLLFTNFASAGAKGPCNPRVVKVKQDPFTKQPTASVEAVFFAPTSVDNLLAPWYKVDLAGGQVTFRLVVKQREITETAMPAGTGVGLLMEDGSQLSLVTGEVTPASVSSVKGMLVSTWSLPLALDKPTVTTLASQPIAAIQVRSFDGDHSWELPKVSAAYAQKVFACYVTLVP